MSEQTVNIAQKRREDKVKEDMISERNLKQNFKNLLKETRNSKDIENGDRHRRTREVNQTIS